MFTAFNATLSPMLVMFTYIVIGFILKKCSIVPDNTAVVLSRLENYVIVPALIINTFMEYCTVKSLLEEYRLILYCTLVLFVALIIAIPLSKVFTKDEYLRNIYKYALTFANFSFMGNAIVPVILGNDALYRYMLYILPLNTAVYTWGMIILIPKNKNNAGTLSRLVNPIFISIIIGVILGLTNAENYLTGFVKSAVAKLAACMGPLAMLLTGFVVGGYDFRSLLHNKRVYFASALRLVILPLLFIGLLYIIGADKDVLVLTLFAFGTPLGLNTVVFPAAYGGNTETGASMAMISHTFCVITIPLLYVFVTYVV